MQVPSSSRIAGLPARWQGDPRLRAAAAYAALPGGPALCVTRSGLGRGPYLPGWARLDLGLDRIADELDRPTKGIGWVLSGTGLVDVDLDAAGAVAVAPDLLPSTDLVHGRTARARSHYWYWAPGAGTAAYRAPDPVGMVVELRAGPGQQTAVPPSPHKHGGYSWDRWAWPPTAVDPDRLALAVARVAVAGWLVEALGAAPEAAVSVVRRASLRTLEDLERRPGAPPLRGWLERASRPRNHVPETAGQDRGRAAQSARTAAILARIDVPGAAALFGVALRRGANHRCPLPGHDERHPSFRVAPDGQTWRCYGCDRRGSAIHLVAALTGQGSYLVARDDLAERVGLPRVPAGGRGTSSSGRASATPGEGSA